MNRLTIRAMGEEPETVEVTVQSDTGRTHYEAITSVRIEIDAPRATRRATLLRGTEMVAMFEGDLTWGSDPPGGGNTGIIALSAYDSLAE